MAVIRGYGFSTRTVEDPDFEHLRRCLDDAASLGADFVELPLFELDVIAGGRVLPGQVARLKSAFSGRGLGMTVHGQIAVNFMAPPDQARRHFEVARAAIEVSAELGGVHIVFHTGSLKADSDGEIEDAHARERDAFAALGEIAAARSVVIVVENVFVSDPAAYTALPSRLARELEMIAHPHVRGCLDFSHAWITCTARGADFLTEAGALAQVSRHLHLHDSFGDPARLPTISRSERVAYGLGDLHLPLGWGAIPWERIMSGFTFEPDVIFNLELPQPYWFALRDSVDAMRAFGRIYAEGRT